MATSTGVPRVREDPKAGKAKIPMRATDGKLTDAKLTDGNSSA